MTDAVEDLLRAYPLPSDWTRPGIIADVVVADGLTIHRAGIASTGLDGEEMVGSAADVVVAPVARAYFELLERISVMEAMGTAPHRLELLTIDGVLAGQRDRSEVFPESSEPARWRYARSNGVAIHTDWRRSSQRAFWELCERDRVLGAWYGETKPELRASAIKGTHLLSATSYEWLPCSFPATSRNRFSAEVHVAGVYGLPKTDAPLVFGYGARPRFDDAMAAAIAEATQLLAFLWGEEPASGEPRFAPHPLFHLETFQRPERHALIRRWLAGGHMRYRRHVEAANGDDRVYFLDLTPRWLAGRMRVSKAICAAAWPLLFGLGPGSEHLPSELQVHPVA